MNRQRIQFTIVRHLVFLCVALSLASCSSLQKHDALGELRQQTSSRLGRNVAVPSSAEEEAQAKKRVAALLKQSLTAESAVEIAILNNRHLRAELADVGIAHADLLAAATWSNPTLAASARFPGGGGRANSEFGIAADVLNWVLTPLRSKIAAKELEKVERRVSHEILSLAFETKAAFYTLQAQQNFIQKLSDIAESNQVAAEIATRIHDAGNINDLQLLNQQVAVSQVQLDIKRANSDSASARAKLNRMMGLSEADGHWEITSNLPSLPTADPDVRQVKQTAMQQRQDVAAVRVQVYVLEQTLSLKRRTRLIPGLNLGVDTERDVDGTRVTGPQLELELPIFNRGKPALQKLEAELRQAQALLETTELAATNDVEAAFAALKTTRDAASYVSTALLPQRQKILKQTLLQYNAMQVSNFDLLLAKQEEQRAEKEAIESLRGYWTARAELEKAAGGSLSFKPAPKKKENAKEMAPSTQEHHH